MATTPSPSNPTLQSNDAGPRPKRARTTGYEPDLVSITNFDFGKSHLLVTGQFSDYIISSGGIDIKVHRACMAGISPFLDGVMTGGFAEEGRRRLELGDPPEAIFIVIWYTYTKTYPAMKYSKLEWTDEQEKLFNSAAPATMFEFCSHLFLPHLEVYKLADMMMLPKLKEIAFNELRLQMIKFAAEVQGNIKFQRANYSTWASMPDFQQVIYQVYGEEATCLGELKAFMAWISVYHAWKLECGTKDFEELMLKVPSFAWSLYVERDKWGPQNLRPCRHCTLAHESYPQALVVRPDHSVDLYNCSCRFRGFCRSSCIVSRGILLANIPVYCSRCASGGRKTWDFNYVVKTDEGLKPITDGSLVRLNYKGEFHWIAHA